MSSTRLAYSILATLALASPALAQDAAMPLTNEDGTLTLTALGQALSLPLPSWIKDAPDIGDLPDVASSRYGDEGNQVHLELYPKGEGEAFWTTHFGARIAKQPSPTLAQFRGAVIDVYARSCKPETVALFQLEPDQDDTIPPLGFVCGAFRDLPGYSGKGEVMIASFAKTDDGMAMVYQEWRGDAFDPSKPANWPISSKQVEETMARFKADTALARAD